MNFLQTGLFLKLFCKLFSNKRHPLFSLIVKYYANNEIVHEMSGLVVKISQLNGEKADIAQLGKCKCIIRSFHFICLFIHSFFHFLQLEF